MLLVRMPKNFHKSGRLAMQHRRRYLAVLAVVLSICMGGSTGWYYLWQRPCTQIEITGAEYTDTESIYSLIDSTLTSRLVVDRIQRHPWVRTVHAVCYPTGIMRVEVEERFPRLLALTEEGMPAYYLDEFGYMMPAPVSPIFNVPLLRGSPDNYHALVPVKNQQVRNLLALISRIPLVEEMMISEFGVTDIGLTMNLRLGDAEEMTTVYLGEEAWEQKFYRLDAFQSLHPGVNHAVGVIDLRFNGQIITREKST